MAKITRHGGLSQEPPVQVLLPGVTKAIEAGPAVEPVEKEEPWPGNSSETSPAKPPKTAEPKKPSPRKRARTTAGPSSSTAASGTAPTGTTSTPATDA